MPRTFNLADLFELVAQAVPERLAFVCGAQQHSFRQLDERANRLAHALHALGLRRGDNVGIALHNSAEFLETFLACCKLGLTPANINYRYVADELAFLVQSLDLKAIVHHSPLTAELAKVQARPGLLQWRVQVPVGTGAAPLPPGWTDYETLLQGGAAGPVDGPRRDDDLFLLCTGGTTGMPKGVIWPHRSLFMGALGGGTTYFNRPPIAQPEELTALVQQGQPMRFFPAAPMMHGAALWSTLITLLAGHTVVVNDDFHFDAEHVWDVIERDRVNIMSVVGDAMAQPLVLALERHPGRWALESLFVLGNGGAALSGGIQQRLRAALPRVSLNNGIGSSETGIMGKGEASISRDGLIVLPASDHLAVLDESLQPVREPGATGVLARTGHTPIGYYGDPVKSAEVFVQRDGRTWVLSGDQARIGEDGQIVVLGRGSQCINTGGEKVFPEEVEGAVRRYPAVADVLVVGLPDERWGQRVTAVVEVAPGHDFDPAEMDRVCREHLSGYKLPRTVVLAERIQRSPAGKANYRWAQEHAQTHPAL
jgi:3-oxocholest-4-en-26-oate---CoA ligase